LEVLPPKDTYPEAKAAAIRAIKLDGTLVKLTSRSHTAWMVSVGILILPDASSSGESSLARAGIQTLT
jgi:chloramphenicol 3-O-phosphotransferase